MIDDMLLALAHGRDDRPVEEAKVVGHRGRPARSDVREFLSRNQVAYRWYPTEDDEGRQLLAVAGADDLSCRW